MKKNLNILKSLLILVLICAWSSTYSQNQPGKVEGAVTLDDGFPIENATVSIIDGAETIAITNTDENGKFSINNLKPGGYKIRFNHLSYGEITKAIKVTDKTKAMKVSLEDGAIDLADVIVTSTSRNLNDISRLPSVKGTSIFVAKKNEVVLLDKLNANVAVNNPRQIFAKVAGTNIWENDGTGIQLNVSSRGLSPNRSWEYNVRQNGYDIAADIMGYPDHYYTPTMEGVERIEVVRGSASLQFGTQLGGLLNFKMRGAPKNKPFEFVTKQTAGSYKLYNNYTSIGGRSGKVEYFAYYHHRSADGWRQNADYRINSGFGYFKYHVNNRLKIGFEMTKMAYVLHLSAGVTDEQFELDPRLSNRERNWFNVDWSLPAITLDYELPNGGKFNMRAYANLSGRNSIENTKPVNIPDDGGFRDLRRDRYRNYGTELRYLQKYKMFRKTRNTILVGTRIYDGNLTRAQGWGNDGNDANFTFINPNAVEYNDYAFDTKNFAFFAEHIFQFTPKLTFTPGMRYENIVVDYDGYFNDDGKLVTETGTNIRRFPLFGAGFQYQINDDINFYANYTEGFRAVHFNDIRVENPNIAVDPDIKDSDGYNADFGFRGQVKDLFIFDVNAFYLAYNDKIGIVTREINGEPTLFRTNVSNQRNAGVESLIEVNLLKAISPSSPVSLSMFASYAYVNSEYLTGEFEGNRAEFAPEHLLKAGVNYRTDHFSITLNYNYTGDQYSDANNTERTVTGNQGYIPSYNVFDLSANWDVKNYTFGIGINNLMNTKYFTRRATSYPGPGVIPAEPRLMYITLGYKI